MESRGEMGRWERHAPLILKNVQTNATASVNVGVINFSVELDLRGLEGIIRRKFYSEKEYSALIRTVSGPHDGRLPRKHILSHRASGTIGGRVPS